MPLLIISNVLLWILVIILAGVIFALIRQIGILYERVAPAGALALNQHLDVGSIAPEINVNTLDGTTLTVGGVPADQKSRLLFFLSPDCPICKTLLPVIHSAHTAESDWLDILLVSDGDDQDHAGFVEQHKLTDFPYIVSEIVGRTYGVSKLPYSVLIDEEGKVASLGIINSREHLDSLFEAKEQKVASIQDYIKKQQANEGS